MHDGHDSLPADLVLEGGGVKGIALVGAVAALVDAGYSFERIAGTSAGAVVGALCAAGMPAGEMRTLATSLDYRQLADPSPMARVPVVGTGLALLRDGWVFTGQRLREWLGNELSRLHCETFGDLRIAGDHDDERHRYRLVVVASDVTRGELIHLPWDYESVYGLDPDRQLVVDAVHASIALPFAFRPVELPATLDGSDPAVRRPTKLVDGGILANFPIEIFDVAHGREPDWPTFGIKILSRLPAAAGDREMLTTRAPLPALRLGQQVLGTMLGGHSQARLRLPWIDARTIRVDTSGTGILDFRLSELQRTSLLDRGALAVRTFLEHWNWREYVATHRRP